MKPRFVALHKSSNGNVVYINAENINSLERIDDREGSPYTRLHSTNNTWIDVQEEPIEILLLINAEVPA